MREGLYHRWSIDTEQIVRILVTGDVDCGFHANGEDQGLRICPFPNDGKRNTIGVTLEIRVVFDAHAVSSCSDLRKKTRRGSGGFDRAVIPE